jgi:hypothetical protein
MHLLILIFADPLHALAQLRDAQTVKVTGHISPAADNTVNYHKNLDAAESTLLYYN